ncbi:MAG: dUTP diphosphatase [Veillonella parvula]|uniref:dUTP diphosphatase n=1 Tax=Veillonella parvula TaxID=29466 RepID=UPI002906558B|nr:dUTP diphosphatase [Veillonella parvula]MDU6636473.1 dUTP diphosphatase [Veillonella parvula]
MGLICKLKKFIFGCEKENIIKVKRFMNGVLLPKMGSAAAAGMDFYQPESVVVEPHQTQYVTLGLAMEIPKGYMLMLAPRSSMSKTPLVIPNSFGVIDADYRGEIKGIFKNTSDDEYLIQKGDRLLQGILVPVGALKLLEVDELTETVRGAGGIGSTGK